MRPEIALDNMKENKMKVKLENESFPAARSRLEVLRPDYCFKLKE